MNRNDCYNTCLIGVGHTPIPVGGSYATSTDPHVQRLNLIYNQVKRDVLSAYDWNDAIRRTTLTLRESTTFEYVYEIEKPDDYIMALYDYSESEYRVEGGLIRSNAAEIQFVYIAEIPDAEIGPILERVIAFRLAAEIVFHVSGDMQKTVLAEQKYSKIFVEQRWKDAKESRKQRTKTLWTDVYQ